MWLFSRKSSSGFTSSATAEQVTEGIDGSNLTAIVTGASSGIGKETARVLALRDVHIIMAVRNMSSGNSVKEEILKEVPNSKIDVLELNLSSMTSVRKFASEFESLHLPLNILINNAGYLGPYALSEDGIELHFATNHLGHFLLTNLLLDNMKETSEKSKIEGRIVNISSEGHKWPYSGGIRFDNINDESTFKTHLAYNQSKLANILHTNELSKRFKEGKVNITANSVHPGAIMTNIFRNGGFAKASINFVSKTLGGSVLKTIQQGAATTCYVALNPQVKGVSGKYFNNCNECAPSYEAMDEDLAAKLWDFSMKMTST